MEPTRNRAGDAAPMLDDGPDEVQAALRQAAAAHGRMRDSLREERRHAAHLEKNVRRLTREREELDRERTELARREAEAREALEAARARLEAERRRSRQLAAELSRVHHGLYAGSTTAMLLQASLRISTATRGYYVSTPDLVVRAAEGVPARVGDAASPFIRALCNRVIADGDPLHWNSGQPPDGVKASSDERHREGIAVPVAVHGKPHGVIVALDKAEGEFQEEDVRSLVSIGGEAGVALENAELRDEVQRAYLATVSLLADTIEAADPYTHGHCQRVAQYARETARRLGMSDADTRVACYAALLHDVGKIGISDGVLNKPGPLLDEERLLIQAHVRIGYDLLSTIPALGDVANAVLHHHEWFDGTGYPTGLGGEAIPLPSRIVAAADAYCAMLDRRSYKEPCSAEEARHELARCAGTQFDPAVVAAMLDAIADVDSTAEDALAGCGLLPGLTCPDSDLEHG